METFDLVSQYCTTPDRFWFRSLAFSVEWVLRLAREAYESSPWPWADVETKTKNTRLGVRAFLSNRK